MYIRLARPTDAPLILSLALSENSHLITDPAWPAPGSLLRPLAVSLIPLLRSSRVWVAREQGTDVLLEVRPRRYVIAWDIVRLNMRGNGESLLPPLLSALTLDMQRQGVPRLFARCNEDTATMLCRHGFEPLAREFVLIGPQQTSQPEESLPADSRYRMPQDAWPLHQLEHELTPPAIRQLEGITSLDWSDRKRGGEVVVERDGRIVAWIAWRRARGMASPMGILIHPDHADLGPELLSHALRAMGPYRPLARVREYQSETLSLLEDAGFTMAGEELLIVKHAQVVRARLSRIAARNVAGLPTIRAFRVPAAAGAKSHAKLLV